MTPLSAIRRDPRTVEFGELECCALAHAFQNPTNIALAKERIENAASTQLRHVVALLGETFERTTRLVFIPQEPHRTFYIELVYRERDYCTVFPEGHKFPCGHVVSEHNRALNDIIFKMTHPYGNN